MKTKQELIEGIEQAQREYCDKLLDVAEKSRPVLEMLPERLIAKASCSRCEWLQFSGCSRDESEEIQIFLKHRFNMRPSYEPDKVDYRGEVAGLRIVISAVPFDMNALFEFAEKNGVF